MKFKIYTIILAFGTIVSSAQQIDDGRAIEITDFSVPLKSGAYQGYLANGMTPDHTFGWQHLFVVRHSNDTNNHQLQLSSSYSLNDRLFFRKITGALESNNTTWIELATRGNNTFNGNQAIGGNLEITENSDSRPLGQTSPTKSVLKLSRNGTVNYSYNENAEFRIGHGGNNIYGSKLDLYINGSANTSSIPDQQVMTWNYDGNVGIGTTNPKNKLDVNGTIHSKEVKIDMTGWSDFVFKKEYTLPTLEEVEKHITEKGHLKNIPNEEEVVKNGINLGEMNAKLLQKIEELTLYMIEMKKENETIKSENGKMKKNQIDLERRIRKIEKRQLL